MDENILAEGWHERRQADADAVGIRREEVEPKGPLLIRRHPLHQFVEAVVEVDGRAQLTLAQAVRNDPKNCALQPGGLRLGFADTQPDQYPGEYTNCREMATAKVHENARARIV